MLSLSIKEEFDQNNAEITNDKNSVSRCCLATEDIRTCTETRSNTDGSTFWLRYWAAYSFNNLGYLCITLFNILKEEGIVGKMQGN